jgi:uncharacterized Zn-finger protein
LPERAGGGSVSLPAPFFNLTFGAISYKLTIMEKVIVYTSSNRISCKGENDVGSHPIVYYHLSKESPEAICGYCGVIFRYDKDADSKTRYP